MNNEEFNGLANIIAEYLAMQKVFIQNPLRMKEVNDATEMACKLFPEANITLEDDPMQMGAVFLCIEDFDITVRETKEFAEIIRKADNFEIFPTDEENIRISIMFDNALTRIAP